MANIFNLLGPVLLGVAVAGILVFLKRVVRLPLPRWLILAGAAAGILGGHLYNDYTWFGRLEARLPDTVEVVERPLDRNALEPWTLIRPKVSRFVALDRTSLKTNPAQPDLVLGRFLLFKRYVRTLATLEIADCSKGLLATISDETRFSDDGVPENADWKDAGPDDPRWAALCRKGA